MKRSFVQACLEEVRVKPSAPFPVPFSMISETFDLDNETRYKPDSSYDDIIKTLFGMGELYGRKKQTHVYLSEPGYKAGGSSPHVSMSDSAGVLAMKYLSFTGKKGFSLAIKPKVFRQPDINSHPMAFGMHGFHDGQETLYVDKLLLPAFDEAKRHRGVRAIPATADSLNFAENYVGRCMRQIETQAPILMYENLRAAVPEKLMRALSADHVGAITPETMEI